MRPSLSLIHLNIFSLIHFFYLDSGLLTRFADYYMSESFISKGVYLYIYTLTMVYMNVLFFSIIDVLVHQPKDFNKKHVVIIKLEMTNTTSAG